MIKKIATVLAAFCMALVPTAAHAHTIEVFQGDDRGWVGKAHDNAGVQDRECDGHPVDIRVSFINSDGNPWVKVWTDTNGCASGGENRSIPNSAYSFRICEINEDDVEAYCSDPKSIS